MRVALGLRLVEPFQEVNEFRRDRFPLHLGVEDPQPGGDFPMRIE
jgi:hypothetical protein